MEYVYLRMMFRILLFQRLGKQFIAESKIYFEDERNNEESADFDEVARRLIVPKEVFLKNIHEVLSQFQGTSLSTVFQLNECFEIFDQQKTGFIDTQQIEKLLTNGS